MRLALLVFVNTEVNSGADGPGGIIDHFVVGQKMGDGRFPYAAVTNDDDTDSIHFYALKRHPKANNVE